MDSVVCTVSPAGSSAHTAPEVAGMVLPEGGRGTLQQLACVALLAVLGLLRAAFREL